MSSDRAYRDDLRLWSVEYSILAIRVDDDMPTSSTRERISFTQNATVLAGNDVESVIDAVRKHEMYATFEDDGHDYHVTSVKILNVKRKQQVEIAPRIPAACNEPSTTSCSPATTTQGET